MHGQITFHPFVAYDINLPEKDARFMDVECIKTNAALVISTILAVVKLYETFWKDRTRLTTTYSFTDEQGVADTIMIVNLSGAPVQVYYWTLAWRPSLFFRLNTSTIDVTPDEGNGMFKIAPKDTHTLEFHEDYSKFDWSYRTARHRQLYLTLHIFGRRPKVLKVGAGQ